MESKKIEKFIFNGEIKIIYQQNDEKIENKKIPIKKRKKKTIICRSFLDFNDNIKNFKNLFKINVILLDIKKFENFGNLYKTLEEIYDFLDKEHKIKINKIFKYTSLVFSPTKTDYKIQYNNNVIFLKEKLTNENILNEVVKQSISKKLAFFIEIKYEKNIIFLRN